MALTTEQATAIEAIQSMGQLVDEILEATDGNVLLLKEDVRRLTHDLDRALDRAEHWITEARHWRDRYIAMRRERNEVIDQFVQYMMGQLDFELHLGSHDDERRSEIRAAAILQRKRMAQELKEMVEMWSLKNGVEAEDLGEPEGSVS